MPRKLTTCITMLLGAGLLANSEDRSSAASIEFLTLRSNIFANTRTIRVWLPPGYDQKSQHERRYPVFYFTDGVATFHRRQLDRVAKQFILSGRIPPTIFVGIDNGGSTKESKNPGSDRANEYLPYPDDSLLPPVPNPHGKLFPAFLEREVRPLVESRYRTTGSIGIAGASYGAAIALFTVMEHPGRYQWLLLESPSLYVGDDALLHRSETFRNWPSRIYVGAGTDEGEGDAKREMVDDVRRLAKSLQNRTATCLVVVPGAVHSEDAWRARLPAALEFLLGGKACPKTTARLPAALTANVLCPTDGYLGYFLNSSLWRSILIGPRLLNCLRRIYREELELTEIVDSLVTVPVILHIEKSALRQP